MGCERWTTPAHLVSINHLDWQGAGVVRKSRLEYGLYKLHQRMGIMHTGVSRLYNGGLLVRKAYDVLAAAKVKIWVSQEYKRTRQHCFICIIDNSSSKLYIHNVFDLVHDCNEWIITSEIQWNIFFQLQASDGCLVNLCSSSWKI